MAHSDASSRCLGAELELFGAARTRASGNRPEVVHQVDGFRTLSV